VRWFAPAGTASANIAAPFSKRLQAGFRDEFLSKVQKVLHVNAALA
jgi:hypothetical protein